MSDMIDENRIKELRERSKLMATKKCYKLFDAFPNMYFADRIETAKTWVETLIVYDAEIIEAVFNDWIKNGADEKPSLPAIVKSIKAKLNRKAQAETHVESHEEFILGCEPETLQYYEHKIKDDNLKREALKILNDAGIKGFTDVSQAPWKKPLHDFLNQKGSKMIHFNKDE